MAEGRGGGGVEGARAKRGAIEILLYFFLFSRGGGVLCIKLVYDAFLLKICM